MCLLVLVPYYQVLSYSLLEIIGHLQICHETNLRIGHVNQVIDVPFLPQVSLEVSVLHEWQDKERRLALFVQTYSHHSQYVGMGESAHDGALFQEAFQLVIG